jgi:formate hydrogenlyase subunit 6/NADH:ubiquinone oxidoreductase subunit I
MRAILLDLEDPNGVRQFVLPPPMAGFFEVSMMRLRNDIDQKVLAELFHQYINVEDAFIKELFLNKTKPARVFVNESALNEENSLTILDYERASEIIKKSAYRGVGICYCRHKMSHLGKACDAPLDICMTFGGAAQSLTKHGFARAVSVSEGMELLERAYSHNLVQIGENGQDGVTFICNCCGCCCEALLAVKRLGTLNSINTTNFIPEIEVKACIGCGRCVKACPAAALKLSDKLEGNSENVPVKVQLDEEACLGCGVCVRTCSRGALKLRNRGKRVITPVSSVHRIVMLSIEKGKLQNLIFDQNAHLSHRAMAAILGAILRMPPVKQVMASEQVKSKYLGALIRRFS